MFAVEFNTSLPSLKIGKDVITFHQNIQKKTLYVGYWILKDYFNKV